MRNERSQVARDNSRDAGRRHAKNSTGHGFRPTRAAEQKYLTKKGTGEQVSRCPLIRFNSVRSDFVSRRPSQIASPVLITTDFPTIDCLSSIAEAISPPFPIPPVDLRFYGLRASR